MRNPFRRAQKEEPVKAKDDLFAWATLRNPGGPIHQQVRASEAAKTAGQWVGKPERDSEETPND